ncbi:MAG: hypothetical protein M3O95_05095 [Candidatus Dormibacteraeota bacterium]|jgi:hypothetical protein|nr:hypothetical protein [Candidatus Dormibacteraeota bacterium]
MAGPPGKRGPERLSRRLPVENGSEEELTGALLAWHGAAEEAHRIFLQGMKKLGDDPTSHVADSTLSALGQLQARIESQLPVAGARSPDSSSDRTAAPTAPAAP